MRDCEKRRNLSRNNLGSYLVLKEEVFHLGNLDLMTEEVSVSLTDCIMNGLLQSDFD